MGAIFFKVNKSSKILDLGVSGQYYTCAPDTIYSVIEAIFLSPAVKSIYESSQSILEEAKKMFEWRCSNEYSWNHELRENFWNILCTRFPSDMLPKGTINAAVDSPIECLASVCPLEVVVFGTCCACGSDTGAFHYQFEGPLLVITSNMTEVPSELGNLCIEMIKKQLKKLFTSQARRVQCQNCKSFDIQLAEITKENLSLPPILIFQFLVQPSGSQNANCTVEEEMSISDVKYVLTSSVISKPAHFMAVSM